MTDKAAMNERRHGCCPAGTMVVGLSASSADISAKLPLPPVTMVFIKVSNTKHDQEHHTILVNSDLPYNELSSAQLSPAALSSAQLNSAQRSSRPAHGGVLLLHWQLLVWSGMKSGSIF